jgi:amidase
MVGGAASVAALAGIGAASVWGDSNGVSLDDGSGGATPPASTQAPPVATEQLASTPDASTPQPPAATPPPVEQVNPATVLETASIRQLRDYLDAGAFTVSDLVQASLARIEEIDGGDIEVNAVITLNPDADTIAAELDADLQAGNVRGPLHGIPVLLKDIIATGDQMPNTAGSLAMQENIAERDAFLVALLREAGAVILGKTNLTEWSNFMGSTGLSGWSSFGGLTVNPHDLNMSASGSSSGSAAAVAAGYVPLAIGAEFDGSIIAPAAQCGVVGLKPTVGLTSRTGVIPIGFTRDSIGPMTKTVEDAAIALSVMAGLDPEDPSRTVGAATATWAMFDEDPVQQPGAVDYTEALDPDALAGARIGICVNFGDFGDDSMTLFEDVIPILEDAGAEVIPEVSVPGFGDLESTYTNSLTEFAWGLQNYLDTFTPDGPMETIQDIVTYNDEHAEDTLAMTDQSGLTDALEARSIDDPTYIAVTETNTTSLRTNGIDAIMDELELDALIAPTATLAVGAWEHSGFASSSNASSLAGYPSITIPIGTSNALPAGIHFFGRAFSEARLLGLAYALEQLLPARPIPEYIPREE